MNNNIFERCQDTNRLKQAFGNFRLNIYCCKMGNGRKLYKKGPKSGAQGSKAENTHGLFYRLS